MSGKGSSYLQVTDEAQNVVVSTLHLNVLSSACLCVWLYVYWCVCVEMGGTCLLCMLHDCGFIVQCHCFSACLCGCVRFRTLLVSAHHDGRPCKERPVINHRLYCITGAL